MPLDFNHLVERFIKCVEAILERFPKPMKPMQEPLKNFLRDFFNKNGISEVKPRLHLGGKEVLVFMGILITALANVGGLEAFLKVHGLGFLTGLVLILLLFIWSYVTISGKKDEEKVYESSKPVRIFARALFVSLWFVVLGLCLLVGCQNGSEEPVVKITSPKNNEIVPISPNTNLEVKGKYRNVPAEKYIWIVISKESTKFYPKSCALRDPKDTWKTKVDFVIEEGHLLTGTVDILAILVNKEESDELDRVRKDKKYVSVVGQTSAKVTITLQPERIATSPVPYPTPILLSPVAEATVEGKKSTEFSWQWNGVLQEGEEFELRMWRSEKPHTVITNTHECSHWLDSPPDGFGQYLWQVAVVRTDNTGSQSTLIESQERSLVWRGVIVKDDTLTVNEDSSVINVDVLTNDSIEPDTSGTLKITAVGIGSADGKTTIANGGNSINYAPAPDFFGTETFTYTVNAGTSGSDYTAIVTVTVVPVNDPPVATDDDNYSVDEDSPLTIVAPGVLANDSDVEKDELAAILVTNVTYGRLNLNSDGWFTYTPNADFNGTDSFTYKANDGTADSDPASVLITVDPVADPPQAGDDSATTDEDILVTIDVLKNDTDVDDDTLTIKAVTQPHSGTVISTSIGVTYTPDANYCGIDSFAYTVSGGNEETDTATVAVTVVCVNDPPVAANDACTVDEDNILKVPAPGVLANDSDVDSKTYVAVVIDEPTNGTLTLNDDGSFTYTPDTDFHGSDSFTYKANDGSLDSNAATVAITVRPTAVLTPKPSPTPSLLPAPTLQGPLDGDDFCPDESLQLTWQWDVRPFSPGEYYGVKVWKDELVSEQWDRHWEADFNKRLFEVQLWPDKRPNVSPQRKYYQGPGKYLWNVVVLRDTGQTVTDKYGFTDHVGEEISEVSETRSFNVRTNLESECWP